MVLTVDCSEAVPMPALLASMSGREGEIRLGYREKVEGAKNKKEVVRQPSRSGGDVKKEEQTDLDLTGSPLSASFDMNQEWNLSSTEVMEEGGMTNAVTGPVYKGVGLAQARGWLSREGGRKNEPEMWVVTNSEDKENTIYLGNRVDDNTRSLAKVVWSKPSPYRTLSGQLGLIMSKHACDGGGRGVTKTIASCEYSIAGGGGDGSSLSVVSSWTKVTNLLEPPPLDATTRLRAKIMPGQEKLSTSHLWEELMLLEGFVKGLSGQGVTWVVGEGESSMEVMVAEMMEAVRTIGPRSGVTKMESETLMDQGQGSESLEAFSLEARQEVDFTDMLWSTLSKAQSYQELIEAFRTVFTTIMTEEIRPFVYARNKTMVVRIVGGLVRGGETLPDLTGSMPLQLLIECGLEKLRRDYSHTLLNSELAAKEIVSHYLESETLEQAVVLLSKLHLVVELTSLCQTFLSLPPDTLRTMVHSALDNLTNIAWDQISHSFDFPLPTHTLREQLARLKPDSWQVKLSTVGEKTSLWQGVDTVARLVVDMPREVVDHMLKTQVKSEEDESGERNDPDYIMVVMTEIHRAVIGQAQGM